MMDGHVQQRRHRSSTSASNAPRTEIQPSPIDPFLKRLAGREGGISPATLGYILDDLKQIASLLQEGTEQGTTQDHFRRGHGFQVLVSSLQFVAGSAGSLLEFGNGVDLLSHVCKAALLVLLATFDNHQGNRRYFERRIKGGGWRALEYAILGIQTSIIQASQADALQTPLCAILGGLVALTLSNEACDAVFEENGFRILSPQSSGHTEAGDKSTETRHEEIRSHVESRINAHQSVHNPEAVALMVSICLNLTRGHPNVSCFPIICSVAYVTINRLTNISVRNKAKVHSSGILSSLVSHLLDDSISGIVLVPLRTLCESLLSMGADGLEIASKMFQKAASSDDARALLLTTLENCKEPASIHFDLSHCGYSSLELPNMPRLFPPLGGYSFSAWFKIDEYDEAYHTTLFGAFDSSQTCFVLIYLEKDTHQLILQTSVTASKPSIRFKSTAFAQGRWHHVALVHRPSRSSSSGLAVLFVDGEFVEQKHCIYPDVPPPVQGKPDGSGLSSYDPSRRRPVQSFFGTPQDLSFRDGERAVTSRWSLAGAHLYDTCLSDEVIAVHQRLGPRYYGNFQDCLGPLLTYRASAELNHYNDLLHPDDPNESEIITATQQKGSSILGENRILISISPHAAATMDGVIGGSVNISNSLPAQAAQHFHALTRTGNSVVFNAARPAVEEALARHYGVAVLTGNPIVHIPQALDDAAWRTGGCLAFSLKLLQAASSDQSVVQAVEILFQSIRDNWRTSEMMEKEHGFGILAVMLREKLGLSNAGNNTRHAPVPLSRKPTAERQGLAMELLKRILSFVGYKLDKPEDSMLVNPMAYRVLLIDFDTWRVVSPESQKLYYQQFVHLVKQNKYQTFNTKRLMKMRIVRKLLDALKIDPITPEALPELLAALEALTLCSTAHTVHRDVATFIAYSLQHERAMPTMALAPFKRPHRSSVVNRSASVRLSASPLNTPGLNMIRPNALSQAELGISVLRMYTDLLCAPDNLVHLKRFSKQVPPRWLLHLVAETDSRVVTATMTVLARALVVLGRDFKSKFVEKTIGFIALKHRLKGFWTIPAIWVCSFAILFGHDVGKVNVNQQFTLFSLLETFVQGRALSVDNPEMLPSITAMLESGLRSTMSDHSQAEDSQPEQTDILKTVVQFLSDAHTQSQAFRDFALSSYYVQELLFVLFPVIAGTDRLSASAELTSEASQLNLRGHDVVIRTHSNSTGERPTIVRSGSSRTLPDTVRSSRVQAPRRTSSFVLINSGNRPNQHASAHFNPVMSPSKQAPAVKMQIRNAMVESLLEVIIEVFTDQLCLRKDFPGFGLFLKVPPGFQEHQAYFESYVLQHTMYHLWNHLQLNQELLLEPRVLTNLARYTLHMAEAVFEGWFIDGAQPLLEFTGKVLDYLQQPKVANQKSVRLCSQAVATMRAVFLRVTLLRLSELDEAENEAETLDFLTKMNYWQTILFSPENQDVPFIRLLCYLLYMQLISPSKRVRLSAANLFRMLLVQKPTEAATILMSNADSSQRHLSTGLMKLIAHDDEEMLEWISDHRATLDRFFLETLAKPWEEFVKGENQKTEETARNRLGKRKDRLKQWQMEETEHDNALHRFEVSTRHWRANIYSQERLRNQRASQDQQENLNNLQTIVAKLENSLKQPCGLFPDNRPVNWQLDPTEARNRMRMRLLPETRQGQEVYQSKQRKASEKMSKLTVNTRMNSLTSDAALSATPMSARSADNFDGAGQLTEEINESTSSLPLLEGDFEMVDDPREDEEGWEDKNRKVMRSLQHGEKVQNIYNVSRVIALEACEGLLIVGKDCLYLQDHLFQRSDGEIVSFSQAPPEERDPYVQMISGKEVKAQKTQQSLGEQSAKHWLWKELLSVSKRRFLFRDVGLEVFFTDGQSYLLTFLDAEIRNEVYGNIVGKAPHVFNPSSSLSPEDAWRLDSLRTPDEVPQTLGSKFANVFNSAAPNPATRKWMKGELSNFQYLMLVNTMAGRTFNDLTQYPVFPWVLADYSSEELDLTDPRSFRDLSKPMGCQHPARESEFRDRYRSFAEMGDDNAPPFHYGTHYSSAMIVTSFLIRLPPFVQSYLLLQGGSFDHADRLFDSVEKAWLSASRDNMTDVRELTPEFFYLPECLTNMNGYDFGLKQGSAEPINNVVLPRWAKGNPHLFIAKHREALESPYVSQHLHEWIDLIFGYKQRGEAALEATNVFHHLSYHGARDLDTIDDPVERLATIGIIHNFGQTPHQVFQRAHPRREDERYKVARLDTVAELLVKLPFPLLESHERVASLIYSPTQERLLCSPPCKLNLPPACKRYVQWCFADHSIRFFSADSKRLLGLFEQFHIGPVSTAMFADSKTFITAGADCTIGIWGVTSTSEGVDLQSRTYLFGHRSMVTVLAASRAFSTLVSASDDGQVFLWDLNRFDCIRAIQNKGPTAKRIQAARVSNVTGHILLCAGRTAMLYTLNGHLLVEQTTCENDDDEVVCCAFYEGQGNEWVERELIFTGHRRGIVNVWSLVPLNDGAWHLQLVKRLSHADPSRDDGTYNAPAITSILPMAQAVYTGDEEGKVWEWNCVQRHSSFGGRR